MYPSALFLLLPLSGCVSDSIVYDPSTHTLNAHRTAVFTNIGGLHVNVARQADGSVTALVDETNVDQTTAVANALAAAAQLALKAATPVPTP